MGASIKPLKILSCVFLFSLVLQARADGSPTPAREPDVGEVEGLNLSQENLDSESGLFQEVLQQKREFLRHQVQNSQESQEGDDLVQTVGLREWWAKKQAEAQEKRETKNQEKAMQKNQSEAVGNAPTVLVEVFKVHVKEDGTPDNSILNVTDKAGEPKEFALVTVNGKLRHAFVVSTAQSYKQRYAPALKKMVTPYTPEGTDYKPQSLDISHYSDLYQGDMPFAVFFNGGIALHSTTPGHYSKLGVKDSGGCSRFFRPDAIKLWGYINPKNIPQIYGGAELAEIQRRVNINVYGFDSTGAATRARLKAQYAPVEKWIQSEVRKDLAAIGGGH